MSLVFPLAGYATAGNYRVIFCVTSVFMMLAMEHIIHTFQTLIKLF